MNELMQFNRNENKNTFTSLELVELINRFREQEGNKTLLRHDNLLQVIRDEFDDGQGGVLNIQETSYVHSQNKQQYPMFILDLQQSRQVLVRESKFVRRAVIQYINKLEEELKRQFYVPKTYAEALRLAAEQAEQIEKLNRELKEAEDTIVYKEDIIVGLVDDIDLATKRQRLNQIVRNTSTKNYSNRWSLLYEEFEKKYHIDLNYRFNRDKDQYKPKIKNKMDYIDRVMNKTNELYELACKVFESDVNELKSEWFDTVSSTNRLVNK